MISSTHNAIQEARASYATRFKTLSVVLAISEGTLPKEKWEAFASPELREIVKDDRKLGSAVITVSTLINLFTYLEFESREPSGEIFNELIIGTGLLNPRLMEDKRLQDEACGEIIYNLLLNKGGAYLVPGFDEDGNVTTKKIHLITEKSVGPNLTYGLPEECVDFIIRSYEVTTLIENYRADTLLVRERMRHGDFSDSEHLVRSMLDLVEAIRQKGRRLEETEILPDSPSLKPALLDLHKDSSALSDSIAEIKDNSREISQSLADADALMEERGLDHETHQKLCDLRALSKANRRLEGQVDRVSTFLDGVYRSVERKIGSVSFIPVNSHFEDPERLMDLLLRKGDEESASNMRRMLDMLAKQGCSGEAAGLSILSLRRYVEARTATAGARPSIIKVEEAAKSNPDDSIGRMRRSTNLARLSLADFSAGQGETTALEWVSSLAGDSLLEFAEGEAIGTTLHSLLSTATFQGDGDGWLESHMTGDDRLRISIRPCAEPNDGGDVNRLVMGPDGREHEVSIHVGGLQIKVGQPSVPDDLGTEGKVEAYGR